MTFVTGTGSPAHTVVMCKQRLEKAGFKPLKEGQATSTISTMYYYY